MTTDHTSAAQRRENPEPREQGNPVPWFVLVLAAALIAFGIGYIVLSPLDTPSEWGDTRTRAELTGPAQPAAGARVDGAAVYAANCVACHQGNGRGLPGVFPPLAGSEWVTGKEQTLVAIVLHGVTGDLEVAGTTYQGAMPPFHAQLGDAQIAAVLTHLRSQWGNTAPEVTADTVAATRKALADRTAPFAGGKALQALP